MCQMASNLVTALEKKHKLNQFKLYCDRIKSHTCQMYNIAND